MSTINVRKIKNKLATINLRSSTRRQTVEADKETKGSYYQYHSDRQMKLAKKNQRNHNLFFYSRI